MPRRSIHSVMSTRTSRTETSSVPLRAAMAWRRNWVTDTPSIDLGVLEGEEQAGLGPHVGGPSGDVLAVEQDGARGHRVGGVAEQRAGQRRLAGAVGAHRARGPRRRPTCRSTPRRMAPSSAETWRSRISSSGRCGRHRPKSLPFWSGFPDRRPPRPVPADSAAAALTSPGRPIRPGGGTRCPRWWRCRGRAAPGCRGRRRRRCGGRST